MKPPLAPPAFWHDPAALDAFCAAALLLKLPPDTLPASVPAELPPWVARHAATPDRQARAALLAPRLLALRVAVEGARLRWG